MTEIYLSATAKIPASTTNLGPGFDVLGIGLSLYSRVILEEKASGTKIICLGEDSEKIPATSDNIAYQAVMKIFDHFDYQPPGFQLTIDNGIPAIRGLGGSGTAILGGLLTANSICHQRFGIESLSCSEILSFATEFEGHPDNVAASLLGGVVVSAMEHSNKDNLPSIRSIKLLPPSDLRLIVAIPDFTLPTQKARSVLPDSVNFSDAVFNIGRSSLLVAALVTDNLDLLATAMQDRLHQPYRAKLIPGFNEVFEAAMSAGALSVSLSGAGPTMIAYAHSSSNTKKISERMTSAFKNNGLNCQTQILSVDINGARVDSPSRKSIL